MSNITVIITSIGSIVPAIMTVTKAFSGVVGLYFTGNSLYQYYSLSNPQSAKGMSSTFQPTVMGATIQLIIAAFLISFAQNSVVQNIISSMIGMDTFSIPASMSYVGNDNLSFIKIQQSLGSAIENIMVMVGSIAILKALLLARRISVGLSRESYAHVWTYTASGALAINIKDFASMLDATFGFNFSRFFF